MSTRIMVLGATGGTGREVVRQALDAGHRVTAFVRRPEALDLSHPNLSVAVGDATDPGQVAAALAGHDGVVCALGAPARNRQGVRARGTAATVEAMRATGVVRLVVVSTFGASESRAALPAWLRYLFVPLVLGPAFADHDAQERVVRESGLAWTLVRPVTLTDQPATGAVLRDEAVQRSSWKIPRADVASFVLDQIEGPGDLRQAVGIAA